LKFVYYHKHNKNILQQEAIMTDEGFTWLEFWLELFGDSFHTHVLISVEGNASSQPLFNW
jgi:hypothetical protein